MTATARTTLAVSVQEDLAHVGPAAVEGTS